MEDTPVTFFFKKKESVHFFEKSALFKKKNKVSAPVHLLYKSHLSLYLDFATSIV